MARQEFSVEDIAKALGAESFGDTKLKINGVAEPQSATTGQLAMATNADYAAKLDQGQAIAAVLWPGADWEALGLKAAIIPSRPRYAMSGLTQLLDPGQGFAPGIHASAIIDPTADIGANVNIGPLTVIGPGAVIGEDSTIGPQCFIGWNARLGPNAMLREQVSIGARVSIGAHFYAQPGVRIGGDGFSFVTEDKSGIEAVRETLGDQQDTQAQGWTRIHSLGAVTIGDHVDLGACVNIDNGTIRDTRIGDGCKMDNFVHIGHNVVIGKDCLICGHSGVAGSTVVGDNVVLGGMTGVSDNIFIGDRVITGGGTKVLSSIPAGRVVLGYPATRMDKQIDIFKAIRRLPRLVLDVAELKKAVFKSGGSD
ncbi:UDP-3-O-(3-hydroxymyristoyl)glucosamine N-acyltransferase [Roseobacter litoralis]|uniref:UDP-3-O-(3-hydroxymyristoyl) glucosamine N-acyltransferase LpxD n=1 Tax=Roseobacter litoralis (strain ATCC 49566 / DSM 6996 / JCM 21268 / NBRC 15278 / OCh 149) TaxID=391595 RepID=F7ZKA7_ROSLO|nr:UDP-3-O-(3-hydroxymyristoyl)glucosamine N-acyltransferase [Roseobacter litoralis]AEI93926.1 UDP-3-O-(3-hydroxymyristoyl) glucosamine N-acyltransferase LpxD [Roseobacter litoralis Och 149]